MAQPLSFKSITSRSSVRPGLHGKIQIAFGVTKFDLGSTGYLHSLLDNLFRSGLIFWLEILHIGTLRARYRAGHYNVANATVSTIDDGGKAQIVYEKGDEEDLTKEDLRQLLEAYGKGLF